VAASKSHLPPQGRPLTTLRRVVLAVATLMGATLLSLQLGFESTPARVGWIRALSLAAAGLILVEVGLGSYAARRRLRYLRRRAPILILLGAIAVEYFFESRGQFAPSLLLRQLPLAGALGFYLVGLQMWLLLALLLEAARLNQQLARWRVRPGRLVSLLFVALILLGTLLLRLPRAAAPGVELSWIDALFTATSAVCVTGLTVVDTARDLSPVGQALLLGLIQLGGLGIMALTGFLAVTLGPGLGIRERSVFSDLLQADMAAQVGRLLRRLVLWTVVIEAMGALLLWRSMSAMDPDRGIWHAVFHSVSSFCNAGFSTFSRNLGDATSSVSVNASVAALVALGSVGIPTLLATVEWWGERRQGLRRPLPSGVRVIWVGSGVLWVGGAILLLVLDRGGSLGELPWATRSMAAFFQSVSARTAGFNTVDIGSMSQAALLLLMLLMFVGGAPGGTAGGIKVTTMSVLLATVRSMLRGESEVLLFGRAVDEQNVREALSLALVAGLSVVVGLALLLLIEGGRFLELAFETVSALCTTGLSTGITSELSQPSRLVVVVLMFVGRVGPLTVALAVVAPRTHRVRHPRQRVPVG
jgi:trk/ktr system potassium uptake protein